MGVCNCSMFCCMLLYVHSSVSIILMGKRELIALLNLSSWCLVMVERLFLPVPRGCLQFVIVVFPGHTHLLFLDWEGCCWAWMSYSPRFWLPKSLPTFPVAGMVRMDNTRNFSKLYLTYRLFEIRNIKQASDQKIPQSHISYRYQPMAQNTNSHKT